MHFLQHMESFVELAKLGNYGRAARVLGITTSSLSRRIQALEKDLGCPLMHRTSHVIVLTDQGRELLTRAGHLLQEAATLKADLTRSSTEIAGHLRIGAPVDLSITVLGPLVAEFCRDHDGITVSLTAAQGQPDLFSDGLDVAFVVVHQRPLPDSTLMLHRIGSFPRFLFASKRYLDHMGTPASPKQLADHQCIRHLEVKPEVTWELRSGPKRVSASVSGVYTSTCLTNAAQAAQQGLGIAILPMHLATTDLLSAERLVRVLPEWEGAPALMFAVTTRQSRPAKVSALLQWLRHRAPEYLLRIDRTEVLSHPKSRVQSAEKRRPSV